MKICLDENISNRVAQALIALTANRDGYEVSWVRQLYPPKTSDVDWMTEFAANGGMAMISGDFNILQNWPNLIAYMESGLISFFPSPPFSKLNGYGRAAFLIRWWPAIVEKIKVSKSGDRWRIPMTWTPDIEQFEAIKDPRIDRKVPKDNNENTELSEEKVIIPKKVPRSRAGRSA